MEYRINVNPHVKQLLKKALESVFYIYIKTSLTLILQMDIFDAAERYQKEGRQVIILAGKEYGSGSSRDWAAKGPWILVSHVMYIIRDGNELMNCRIVNPLIIVPTDYLVACVYWLLYIDYFT